MKSVAIIAPCHIQPTAEWVEALRREAEYAHADVYIVDDSDGQIAMPESFEVFGYARQRELMGKELYELFEQFHKSAACKQFGLWWAMKQKLDMVIMIDSDCVVPYGFVNAHTQELFRVGDGWSNPLEGTGWHSRGFPFHLRDMYKVAHMGLWSNELDLYGTDRIELSRSLSLPKFPPDRPTIVAPFFPLSGMNVSFTQEAFPFMLFLPNFKHNEERFTRHDDIWGGYIFQKWMYGRRALSYGKPHVFHDTIVVPEEDAADETAMIAHEQEFVAFVDMAFRNNEAAPIWWHLAEHAQKSRVFTGLESAFRFQELAIKDI